ncbi:tRNA-binding protein [Desulfovibrio ferrophilus]|uniref:Export-related chaperone CsaA n=1 Tax=Desulfovibrio ferrophilus TaxID=241368 RepID=A0A2Z6AZH3_9BACT|nr:tRNA-binding protein [Desulfovibrio ferrophilus]BBD08667.1 export-related chaperone CsaA [Desulfovibrio ferrophilus]
METIDWNDFEKVELRVGTVTRAEVFAEAKIPAHKVWVDFGEDVGELKTSARVTDLYTPEELVGRQVVGVVNFPVKQIGPIRSEFLLTGFPDENGHIVLAVPDKRAPNGSKLA